MGLKKSLKLQFMKKGNLTNKKLESQETIEDFELFVLDIPTNIYTFRKAAPGSPSIPLKYYSPKNIQYT